MQLPNQWLWDMVDEFVYQFQSFCQYRAKLKTKTEDELNQLKQFDKVATTSKLLLCFFSCRFCQLLAPNKVPTSGSE
jgi:hypothetical protein